MVQNIQEVHHLLVLKRKNQKPFLERHSTFSQKEEQILVHNLKLSFQLFDRHHLKLAVQITIMTVT